VSASASPTRDRAESAGVSVEDAYRRCEAITRAQAANFYYGIRLLPRERRRATCAAYAFARRVDDIGDGELGAERKLALLAEAGEQLAEVERARAAMPGADPVLVALADAIQRFALPAGALGELIEGVRMDVVGTSYERFEELVLYCRRVAGAIGRVCLAIFAARAGAPGAGPGAAEAGRSAEAESLADDLGVALQLTNILRDLREDAQIGRVYLPGEDLRRFGLLGGVSDDGDRGGEGVSDPREAAAALVRFEAERAQQWFERGLRLAPLLDRRSAACVLAMSGIYRRVLVRIESDPGRALRARVSLPAGEKAWVALRSVAGRAA
jgi:15-cis-phytoene synthase